MMRLMKRGSLFFSLFLILCVAAPHAEAQQVVHACGAVSVALPLSDAGSILRSEQNIEILLRAGGGTNFGLDALGDRSAQIALCSREVTPVDRADYPDIQFTEIPIGVQLVALAVSRDVWQGGVHSLSATQARAIYEGKIKNWKEVGGPDFKITIFMSEPGRGQWEMFVQWLYGEIKKAPVWHGLTVKDFQETRNMLEFTMGSFSLIPARFVDNRNVFAVAIRDDAANLSQPTVEEVLKEKYPLSRPLLLVTDNKPTGTVKVIIDFMVSERGQALVKQYGYVTLAELKAAKAAQ